MNIFADNIQLGFLFGIYFLALAIITLTLVYFSRPRHQIPATKKAEKPLTQTSAVEEKDQTPLPENSETQQSGESVEKTAEPLKTVEPMTPVKTSPEPTAKKEKTEMNYTDSQKKNATEKPESQTKINTPPVGSPVHPPLITVTNVPKIQGEPVATSADSTQGKKIAQGGLQGAEAQGEARTETSAATSSNQNVKEDPKPSSPNTDFSELFTEDTEENETSRLAKELTDIDADSLLQTSQNLVNQFRKKS
jgi:hypothetical protein